MDSLLRSNWWTVLICLSCLYKNNNELNIFVLDVCESNDEHFEH